MSCNEQVRDALGNLTSTDHQPLSYHFKFSIAQCCVYCVTFCCVENVELMACMCKHSDENCSKNLSNKHQKLYTMFTKPIKTKHAIFTLNVLTSTYILVFFHIKKTIQQEPNKRKTCVPNSCTKTNFYRQ